MKLSNDIDADAYKVTNLADGVDPQDAATVAQLTAQLTALNSYAPGTFTVADGTFKFMVEELQLTGTNECAVLGSGVLSIQ